MVIQTREFPFFTRLFVPRRHGCIVNRRRLIEEMTVRLNRRVQVVCAPAGYGKTSLLVDLAEQAGVPVCWYSLAPEDSDPAIFLRNCRQSIRNRRGGSGEDCASIFQTDYQSDWTTGLGLLIDDLQREIAGRLIFILDDVHWIHGKEEIEQALASLVERAPDNIHFVLGSRVWPSFGCLPKLGVTGELTSMNVKDLCFSADETRELLGIMWDRDVTPSEAQEVDHWTRGWPAAITLLANRRPTTASSDQKWSSDASDEGMLFGYLSNEIFDKQPDSLKHFLLRASVLKEFTMAQCSSLFGIEKPKATIDQIRDRGLFLEEGEGVEPVYAFHELFRKFLVNRYQSEDPPEYRATHYAAAVYFYALDDYDSAIHHYFESGDWTAALAAIKSVAGTYYAQGKWQTLESMLNRLPKNVIDADPRIILLRGQLSIRLGNPTEALALLDRLTGEVETQSLETKGNALVAKSTAYRRLGHLELAINAAKQGLDILLKVDSAPEYIAEAHKQLGNSYSTLGEFGPSNHHFQTGLELIDKGNLRLHSLICNDLGANYMEMGELGQAAVYLQRARAGLTRLGSQSLLTDTLINLALVYFHQGEFDLALDEIQKAIDIAEDTDYPRVLATGLMNRSIFEGAIGDHSGSLNSALQALELSNQILDQRLIAESTNVLGRAYRKLGETFRAEFLLRQAVTEAEKSGQKYIAATYNISLGKVYCQVGSYTEALESLGIAEKQLNELHSLRELAEVKLYQAAAFYRCGKIKETLACLSHTQKLCPKDGFDGFLLADSGELLDVLNFGMAKRVGWNGLASLVARISAGQRPRDLVPTSPGQSGPPLGLLGLRVHSLGESKIWLDSHEVSDGEWRTKKAKELFYFLLARKNLASKEEIVESLWPNKSLEFRTSKLKTTVYRLRQALFFDCIQADDSGYRINPEISVEFDLDEFRKCLKSAGSAAAGPEARQQHLSKAVELHAGPFLNGYDSEWCDELRFDVGAKYQAALMNLAAYQTAGGNFQRAIELLEKIIATDPWDEEAQYQCIQNYINCEDPFQALQQLRKFDRLSAVELGCDLPPRFTECRRRIQLLMPSPA